MSKLSRYVEVIYCDDIREEVGNKLSYMGVYTSELFIPSTPITLPKLCLAVKVVTDINDPFESLDVRIVKSNNGDEIELLSTGSLPIPQKSELPGVDHESTLIFALMSFVLSPFQIDEETILRVKANTEREELSGPALRIRISPQSAAPHTIQ